MRYRKDEAARLWFRTGRVFCVDGQWYFHTREGLDVGPYATELEACIEADLLKSYLHQLPDSQSRQTIRDFAFSSVKADASGDFLNGDGFTGYVVRESTTNLTLADLVNR